jgi:hypothetical protein
MTCSTLRCRQVSTWSGSGRSGISVTTAGTLPFGFLPGRPFGLAAVSVPLPPGAPGAPSSSELLSINADLRIWWLTP